MRHRLARTFPAAACLASLLSISTLSTAAHAGAITVYSALEEDEIAIYLAAAKDALPGVDINVLRLSTGDLSARLVAEAANPQADVVWGFAVTNMLDPQIKSQLAPYQPAAAATLPAAYKGSDQTWFAATGYMGAFCVNTEVLKAKNLPMPTSWADLAKPVYKGEVVMPDPSSSGTGYLQVEAILQGLGKEKGWALIESVDKNIAQYTTSGSKPCKMARSGEYAIGASLSFVAMQSIDAGFPVTMVVPSDWEGYELEASALLKTSHNAKDAKAFLDWTLSPQAAQLYTSFKAIITIPGAKPSSMAQAAGLPEDLSKVLYPMDFAASAAERPDVLKTWKAKVGR